MVNKKLKNNLLPKIIKSGVENLSGISMNNVTVHYNSDNPAQLNALSFAEGTETHVSTSQQKHLPYEAWHVVEQKQGRIKPMAAIKTKRIINDDAGLENEAEAMGLKAKKSKMPG
jgi:hypothetical protein